MTQSPPRWTEKLPGAHHEHPLAYPNDDGVIPRRQGCVRQRPACASRILAALNESTPSRAVEQPKAAAPTRAAATVARRTVMSTPTPAGPCWFRFGWFRSPVMCDVTNPNARLR